MDQVCSAIREGRFDDALTLLETAQCQRPHDGYSWNLLGVVHECRRDWKQARRAYGKAIAADPRLNAPQQNMRRMYELLTYGSSAEPPALGDHEILLRECLEDSLTHPVLVSTPC
jgi:tetratricopeptide (TPR) repeat protein